MDCFEASSSIKRPDSRKFVFARLALSISSFRAATRSAIRPLPLSSCLVSLLFGTLKAYIDFARETDLVETGVAQEEAEERKIGQRRGCVEECEMRWVSEERYS